MFFKCEHGVFLSGFVAFQLYVPCGKKGIRTLGTRKSTTVFETAPIDHSGIFPYRPIFGIGLIMKS